MMTVTPDYLSQFPEGAEEVFIRTHADGRQEFEIRLNGAVIGDRFVYREGDVIVTPLLNGQRHGIERHWNAAGALVFEEPFAHGQIHGEARQWSTDGTLIGTYRLERGTGLDLWRDNLTFALTEEWPRRNGILHGFTRFWNGDDRTISEERHYVDGHEHGIHREWNNRGRLRRGFPKYYVCDEQVSKRAYLRACSADATLPPFREEDNLPQRALPQEYLEQIARGIGLRRCGRCHHTLSRTDFQRCPACSERLQT